MVAAAAVAASPAVAHAAPTPPFIPPTADWLTTVNYYRAMAGLSPVAENADFSAGAAAHSCYMLYNGISHDEVPGNPGYTPAGDLAGNSGNVAVSSVYGTSARSHIELWMTGPFHAIGILRPNLQTTGFGKCDLDGTPTWHSGATLDVLRGLGPSAPLAAPIVFPGNGTTTNLSAFKTESPNPLTFCGWTAPAGLPVIAMMPEAVAGATATITGPSGPLEVCVLSAANTTGVAQSILQNDRAVVVVPRAPLGAGTYNVSVSTTARTASWAFTVDPTAATGVMPPTNVGPASTASGLQPVAPSRVVDSRENLGTTTVFAGETHRIQIAGTAGVPGAATALLANVTVTNTAAPGYVTLWNCTAERPLASTVNFGMWDTVSNATTVPLDASGGLCVYSMSSTDVVIDVNGYYVPGGPGKYSPVVPVRLMDSREAFGAPGRLGAGQTIELPVTGRANVPTGASAAALNVTSVYPSENGYVTVYPCSGERPLASSLNPAVGLVRPSMVMAPLSDRGTVCLYTLTDVDIVVDIVGYVSPSATTTLKSATPFRFTDTRDPYQFDLNAGTGGAPLGGGQVMVIPMAGQRGIPSNATAISANVTVVDGADYGYLTAYPCGVLPTASTVNFQPVKAVANAAILPLSASGSVCVYTLSTAHVVIDVNGWYSS